MLTIWQLRFFGKYRGDVVVIVGSDLARFLPILEKLSLKIRPVYFPEFDLVSVHGRLAGARGLGGTEFTKSFQYHKFHVFDEYFTRWEKVLYIDSGMNILKPIDGFWTLDTDGALLAHADGFPTFEWKLKDQFNWVDFPDLASALEELVDGSADYFQTTMMLFDTRIISATTVGDLLDLTRRFPNSRTNDQGIVNLWALPQKIWRPLPAERRGGLHLYDFSERERLTEGDYVMLKYPKSKKLQRHGLSNWAFRQYWRLVMWRFSRGPESPQ